MSREDYLKDIDYIKTLAEEGANTPLLGGSIGLMWGVLLSITFFIQWMILARIVEVPPSNLVFLWLAYAVLGGIGCMILGRKLSEKPGANSVANKVESYVWTGFGMMMITLFFGVILNLVFGGGTANLFDFLVIVGFAAQGFAYSIVARITRLRWIGIAALSNFVFSCICFAAFGQPHIYLIAAIGIVPTVIIPSLITLKGEPKDVV